MERAQIQFTSEQLEALHKIATKERRSVADIVRESLDSYLGSKKHFDRKAEIARAKRAAGMYASGVSDVSSRHDDYLAGSIL